jgi:hypothetical protein
VSEPYLARLLPPDEWYRLGLPAAILPTNPDRALVIVVEDQGQIVGRWMAYETVILEGLAIAATHQKRPGVARQLLQAMTRELAARGVPQATTLIQDPEVAALAERHGLLRLPGQLWVLDLRPLLDPTLSDDDQDTGD